jgi:1-piperideine-2-carboxylate/1-pyrroline-2-carboxylate reductase [NAD(P)H]
MQVVDARGTAALTPYPALVQALRRSAIEALQGTIACPQRAVVPLADGGAVLSMVASASDIAVHKLVTVVPANPGRGLPTIQGHLSVWNALNGTHLVTLDGATVTGRRTAALSLLGVEVLLPHRPRSIHVIGTGVQARHHVEAISQLYPGIPITVAGRTPGAAQRFCAQLANQCSALVPAGGGAVDESVDVVISCTTSRDPVYAERARPGRLVVAVGSYTPEAAEIAEQTVRSSRLYVDDVAGARAEAGDPIRAAVD